MAANVKSAPLARSARQLPERPALVQGDMVGLVALDLILRLVPARVMNVAFVVHVLAMHADDSAAHPAGLRVPADVIAHLKRCCHELGPKAPSVPDIGARGGGE